MRQDRFAAGSELLLVTVLPWGGILPVGKAAVAGMDPFWLAALVVNNLLLRRRAARG